MRKSAIFSITVIFVILLSLFFAPMPAKAAGKCECVAYVKNYFGITESVGNAYQMGKWLLAHGFTQIANPESGAVAVMQPGFPGTSAGHVGIINSVSYDGNWVKLNLRGANQTTGGKLVTEFDCNNVRITAWPKYPKGSSGIAYYKVKKYAIKSALVQSGYPSLYFTVNGNSIATGAYVIVNEYTGAKNQLFNIIKYGGEYKIISRNSGMCIVPQTNAKGTQLVQKRCVGNAIEKWQLRFYSGIGYKLLNTSTGWVADLKGGNLTSGSVVQTWASHDGMNQRWLFKEQ